MNRDDIFIGRLEDYLDSYDGVTPLPGGVRDAIHAELPRTRQVRPALGPGRMLDVITRASARARWGLAAAGMVAAVALGAAVINGGLAGPGIGAAPQAPSPSPSPFPSPTETPAPPTSLSGAPLLACVAGDTPACLAPGTYRLSSSLGWPGQVSLTVPAGWFQWFPTTDFEGVLVDTSPESPQGSGWGLMFVAVGSVSKDPCSPGKGTFAPGETSTVDGLVAAMRAWPGFESTTPAPVTVGGFSGLQVELQASTSVNGCTAPLLWTTPMGWRLDAYPLIAGGVTTGRPAQFRILDVNGTLLVIRTTDFPETSPNELAQGIADDPTRHAADQTELHQILDSIKVTTTSE
jgi:hypothetical protein